MNKLPVNSFLIRTCSTRRLGFDPPLSCPSRRLVITPKFFCQNAKCRTPFGTSAIADSPKDPMT